MENSKIKVEETNLEDLIILGEDNHVPILIEFPQGETLIKAKALIKPLTLKEMHGVKINTKSNTLETSKLILSKGLLKQDGSTFSNELIEALPLGVINQIGEAILNISGFKDIEKELKDF